MIMSDHGNVGTQDSDITSNFEHNQIPNNLDGHSIYFKYETLKC